MELFDIIVYSLKIFCITVISAVTFSYLIYKIKDRKRSKPYLSPVRSKSPSVKIQYQNVGTKIDRFAILHTLDNSQTNIISVNENRINNSRLKIVKNIPLNKEEYLLNNSVSDNLNILDHYSVDYGEQLYKVKI